MTELPLHIRELRFRRNVEQLHRLGPRVLYELLSEIGESRGILTLIEDRTAAFARLEPGTLTTAGGDRFPALLLHEVV